MSNIDWNDTIKKEARGINGEDLGEIQTVEGGNVMVQKGLISKEKYYIPQDKAVDYDGAVVRFNISEDEMKSQYSEISLYEMDTTDGLTEDRSIAESQTDETTTVTSKEEKLDVSTRAYEDKVKVTKVPETITETREVPVTHEEISIERRQPTNTMTTQEPILSTQEIEIPIKREEVVVTKTPYIKEEVVIRKNPVTETETVTEEVASEDISTSENT